MPRRFLVVPWTNERRGELGIPAALLSGDTAGRVDDITAGSGKKASDELADEIHQAASVSTQIEPFQRTSFCRY